MVPLLPYQRLYSEVQMTPCPKCGQPCEKKVIGKSSFPQYQPDDITYTPIHVSVKELENLLVKWGVTKELGFAHKLATVIYKLVYGGEK